MSDEGKKIIVDDDWKAEARREKERLTEQSAAKSPGMPDANFAELLNLIAMQALAAMGLLSMPGGERMPTDLAAAKHFIDLLSMLEAKTQNNLAAEEKRMLDGVLYELRMRFVQIAGGAAPKVPGVSA